MALREYAEIVRGRLNTLIEWLVRLNGLFADNLRFREIDRAFILGTIDVLDVLRDIDAIDDIFWTEDDIQNAVISIEALKIFLDTDIIPKLEPFVATYMNMYGIDHQ